MRREEQRREAKRAHLVVTKLAPAPATAFVVVHSGLLEALVEHVRERCAVLRAREAVLGPDDEVGHAAHAVPAAALLLLALDRGRGVVFLLCS